MTEQFGFWVACVVLIAVVAGGCEMETVHSTPSETGYGCTARVLLTVHEARYGVIWCDREAK